MADSKPITSRIRLPQSEEQRARKAAYDQTRYEAKKEILAARRKLVRDSNKESIATRSRKYYQTHKEHHKKHYKDYKEANKEQVATYQKNYRIINKEARTEYNRKYNKSRKYGITLEQYDQMMTACGNRCPCCKVPFSKIILDRPVIDHCHQTGKIRGIICARCNFVLGHANDNSKVLRACAKYLEKSREQHASEIA